MKITLNENLYNFCQELNNVQWIKGKFSAIVLDTWKVELYFNDKKVGISELKGIFNNLQAEIDDGYDEFYLDLDRVEGNKLFFTKGYEERD